MSSVRLNLIEVNVGGQTGNLTGVEKSPIVGNEPTNLSRSENAGLTTCTTESHNSCRWNTSMVTTPTSRTNGGLTARTLGCMLWDEELIDHIHIAVCKYLHVVNASEYNLVHWNWFSDVRGRKLDVCYSGASSDVWEPMSAPGWSVAVTRCPFCWSLKFLCGFVPRDHTLSP